MFKTIKNAVLDKIKNLNDSYEFKPLLSEIEESPVSPLGRFTFWVITSLIFIIILWLIIGKIDVVVTSRGVVIPDGEAKIIQTMESGVIDKILIKESDFVKKDQLLISINSETTQAQLETINKNLEQNKVRAQRLKASGTGLEFDSSQKTLGAGEVNEVQKKLYEENLASLHNAINAKQQEISQINNQIVSYRAQKADYEFQLKSSQDRLERLKSVIDIIAYNEYQEQQNRVNSLSQSVTRADAEIKRLQAQKNEINNLIAQLQADFKSRNLDMLASTQEKINELNANKELIEFSNKNKQIIAPCDGYIDKLMVHTIGGIVQPAQQLVALTPIEKPLIIKAQVLNKDIGFIKPGMPVSIKVDTFDFQKYGILHGTVKSISKNSIEDEKLGRIYEVYITPKEDTLVVEGKEQKISPGMTLNAEIEVNKRRIIEFFIYPLIKYLDEGISVR